MADSSDPGLRTQNLEDLLSRLIDDAQSLKPVIELMRNGVPLASEWMLAGNYRLNKVAEQVRNAIVSDPRFPGNRVFYLCGENGTSGFYPNFFARPFVFRLLQTSDAAGTIQWLQKVLSASVVTGQSILALWGAPVERAIDLTEEVAIVPIAEIAEGFHKRSIMSGIPSFMPGPLFSLRPPESALVAKVRIDKCVAEPHEMRSDSDAFLKRYETLVDIMWALTMIGPRVVVSAGHWFTFDDPEIEEALLGGGGMTRPRVDIMPSGMEVYPPLDADFGIDTVRGYLNLPHHIKDRVRVGLQRLSQSMSRRDVGDQAVELATAFEAIVGDDATTEMTHKVRTRTVRLLGGSDDERRRNSAFLKKCYEIRSALVHTGRVAKKTEMILNQRVSQREIISQATDLLGRLLLLVTANRSLPEWSVFDITEQQAET